MLDPEPASNPDSDFCCATPATLNEQYGPSIRWYFQYVKYTGIVNLVLSLIGLISMLPQWVETVDSPALAAYQNHSVAGLVNNTYAAFDLFLVINTSLPHMYNLWLVTLGSIVVVLLLGLVAYPMAVRRMQQSGNEDPFAGRYDNDSEECVNKIHDQMGRFIVSTRRYRCCRDGCTCCVFPELTHSEAARYRNDPNCVRCSQASSALLFVLSLGVYGAIQYVLQNWAVRNLSSWTLLLQVLLSILYVLIDAVWQLISQALTMMECHKWWPDYHKSDCFKSFICRIATLTIFMTVQNSTYSTVECLHLSAANNCTSCLVYYRARQMFILIAVDISLSSLWNVVQSACYHRVCYAVCGGRHSLRPDHDFRQPFDLAAEYTQIIVRQFLINSVIGIVPMVAVLGALGSLMEYWLDQVKLRRWSRPPQRSDSTFLRVIVLFTFINLAAMFISYPNGIFWLLWSRDALCLSP